MASTASCEVVADETTCHQTAPTNSSAASKKPNDSVRGEVIGPRQRDAAAVGERVSELVGRDTRSPDRRPRRAPDTSPLATTLGIDLEPAGRRITAASACRSFPGCWAYCANTRTDWGSVAGSAPSIIACSPSAIMRGPGVVSIEHVAADPGEHDPLEAVGVARSPCAATSTHRARIRSRRRARRAAPRRCARSSRAYASGSCGLGAVPWPSRSTPITSLAAVLRAAP